MLYTRAATFTDSVPGHYCGYKVQTRVLLVVLYFWFYISSNDDFKVIFLNQFSHSSSKIKQLFALSRSNYFY